MQVEVTSPKDSARVVAIDGDVDLSTAAALRAELIRALDGVDVSVLDLTGLGFIDSTGLGVLVGRLRAQRQAGGDLRLVINSERILRNFRITGLDKLFAIYDSTAAALAA